MVGEYSKARIRVKWIADETGNGHIGQMRILLLSAYAADSHQQWQQGLCSLFAELDWTILTLPPRHFSWRVRGNPLSWLCEPALSRQYDRVLATSMVDLATLRGLWPGLASIPATLYMHENQFAYPVTEQAHGSLEPQMVQLYSALAAEKILFNSRFNQDSFFKGVTQLLGRFPDQVPDGVVDRLKPRALVLPVGLDDKWFQQAGPIHQGRPIRLLWNHRWEYDKAPERLLAFLRVLAKRGVDFDIDVLGRSFRRRPGAFDDLERSFSTRIGQFGFVADEAAYRQRLARADVVLSTALHDFQGLAVMQAAAGGCRPLVPDRLAYPEFFEASCRYPSYVDDPVREAEAMADFLPKVAEQEPPGLDSLRWNTLKAGYAGALGAS